MRNFFPPKKFLDPTPKSVIYVVANRKNAVLYIEGRNRRFQFLDRLVNRDGDLMEAELDSDKPGSGRSSAGGTIHHGLDRRFKHHENVARTFAKSIAQTLSAAREKKRFSSLVLVAEPHFMGLLRTALDSETRKTVKSEVLHEYAQGSDSDLHSQILRALDIEVEGHSYENMHL